MKKMIVLLLVLGLVMGLSVSSLAWGGRSAGRMGGARPGYPGAGNYQTPGVYAAEELGLTDEQTARIQELREQFAEDTSALREQLVEKRQAQHDLYFSSEISEEEIAAAQEGLAELRNQLAELKTEFMLQLRGVLTAEQLEKAAGFKAGLGLGFRMGAGNTWRMGPQMSGTAGRFNFRGRGYYGPGGGYGMGCRW